MPVDAALLPGSESLILDGVHHNRRLGRWYGSDTETVGRWWPQELGVGGSLVEGVRSRAGLGRVWMPPDGTNKREYPWEVRDADADALRSAMSHYPTGVTVVTSGREEKVEGMTANAVISVSLDPLLFLVSVHKDARINQRIREEGSFTVNLLADDQEGLSRLFASPERSSGLPALHSLGGGYGRWGRRWRPARLRRSTASWPRSTREATTTCSSAGSSRSVWAIRARDH